MYSIDFDLPRPDGETPPGTTAPKGQGLFRALWRRKWLIVGCTLLGAVVGAVLLLVIPPRYYAEAVILVQPSGNSLDPSSAVAQATPEIVRSQVEVIRSPRVIERVVQRLRLWQVPEFSPSTPLGTRPTARQLLEVNDKVAERLNVENDGRSFAIKIGFNSQSPQRAALIADTFAAEYIDEQRAQKNRRVEAARSGLAARLNTLRNQVFAAEQEAEAFRQRAGLVTLYATPDTNESPAGMTYAARQLSEMTRQMADLGARRAQADARARTALSDVRKTGGRSTPEVLSSPVISNLLQQDAELARNEAALAERYREGHPLLDQVRSQRQQVRQSIERETRNILSSVQLEAEGARQADRAAQAQAAGLERQVNEDIQAAVRYRQLQREAQLRRTVYEEFAQQVGRISERAGVQVPDAVLIAGAPIPLTPASPNGPLILVMSVLTGLVGGTALAFLLALQSRRPAATTAGVTGRIGAQS